MQTLRYALLTLVLTAIGLMSAACKPCSELSVSECGDRSGCSLLGARPLDAERECLGTREDVACTEAGQDCGGAITYATDPSGDAYRFSSTCIPDGWSAISSEDAGDGASEWPQCPENETIEHPCRGLAVEACKQAEGCRVLAGHPVDLERFCRLSAEPVGCVSHERGCDDAETAAEDPTGEPWLFADSCLPDGWERTAVAEWCDPAPAPPAGEELACRGAYPPCPE